MIMLLWYSNAFWIIHNKNWMVICQSGLSAKIENFKVTIDYFCWQHYLSCDKAKCNYLWPETSYITILFWHVVVALISLLPKWTMCQVKMASAGDSSSRKSKIPLIKYPESEENVSEDFISCSSDNYEPGEDEETRTDGKQVYIFVIK